MPRIYPKREVPPNTQFNNYRVLYELEPPAHQKSRARWFQCECDCGNQRPVRMDNLGQVTACVECSKKHDPIYKQIPGCRRNIEDSHAWECWTNMIAFAKSRDIPVCQEWQEFRPFLDFYLSATGLTLTDVLQPRTQRSYYHAERINKESGWDPTNTIFERFVTERARHVPTYQYWNHLRKRNLLEESLLNYKEFVNTFGVKAGHMTLTRKDISEPHSKQNSYWIERNVRREY